MEHFKTISSSPNNELSHVQKILQKPQVFQSSKWNLNGAEALTNNTSNTSTRNTNQLTTSAGISPKLVSIRDTLHPSAY